MCIGGAGGQASGRLYYEVELVAGRPSDADPQIGVVGASFPRLRTESLSGVGDLAGSSWGVGRRRLRWGGSSDKWGGAWQTGDVIGIAVDLDVGSLSVSVNGRRAAPTFTHMHAHARADTPASVTLGPANSYHPPPPPSKPTDPPPPQLRAALRRRL